VIDRVSEQPPVQAPLSPRPPPTWRVVYLIGLLSWARYLNRWSAFAARRQRPAERAATARKPATGRLLMLVALALFGLQAVRGSTSLIQHVSLAAERRADLDRPVLSQLDWWQLRSAAPEDRERVFGEVLVRDSSGILDEEERAERQQRLRRAFREQGAQGFRETQLPSLVFWPGSEVWYQGADEQVLLRPLAIVAFLLSLAQLLQHTAGADEHLARVGSSLEWLFTFPVRARALFLARACAALFGGQLVWPVIFPFYAALYACAGLGLSAVPLAVAAASYQALLAGGLRVLVETCARRYLPLLWISRLQALLASIAVLALVAGIGLAYSHQVDGLLSWSERLPLPLLFLPLCLPIWFASSEWALSAGLGAFALCMSWLGACVWVAERMVHMGVTSGEGLQQGVRGAPVVPMPAEQGHRLWAGVSYKELCALLRDSRLRAQTFLMPLLVFGMQFWLNPRLLQDITGGPQHIATAAYAVASLTLATGACSALASEGNALWMLYTAPERLEILLLHKLRVWLAVAYLFATATLLLAFWRAPQMLLPTLPHLLLAAVGVALYAVIALGIGSLGTDPLEPEPRRRVRVRSLYLFMTLSSLFAYSIYTPSLWAKLVQLVLSALLAYALWQKLRDHLPYLLDPSAAPPPQIGVADGIIAALGFFVLQGVFAFLLRGTPEVEGRALLGAFTLAGLTVTLVALLGLARSGVPSVLSAVGLVPPAGGRRRLSALVLGVAAGALAGVLALAYGVVVQQVEVLREWAEQGRQLLPELEHGEVPGWFLALGVLAAPLFEELIFRGILYRGLRRSLQAASAVLFSALVFALVHPAVSALPVFVMALLAAAAYERTGWLATPIAAHMTYNAILLGSSALL
jgi:membrane protease YdiL (CAAX protease family)